ncbi:MAG: replicative DNA helicase [Lachnospiraceae bacterium]|nr:replicative DNA helicase [Lachnospiraceae bacterium]MBR6275290.1 replicative DNA helicase [Lachnospiraceae bacterium]
MDENLVKRIMPHSEEAEVSVIGSMLMDRDAVSAATEMLNKDDFYETRLGIFFDVISKMFNENATIDIVTVQNRLRQTDLPEEYYSLEYISKLLETVPTSANVKYYADIVRNKSLLRQFIRTTEGLCNVCYQDKAGSSEIFADAEKKIFEIFQKGNSAKDFTTIDKVVLESLSTIEKAAKMGGSVTGVPTGFLDLDYMTAGMQPSDLVLIAARPSMGKTAFVLNVAEHMAIKNDYTTCIFSLEMSKTQLVNRMLSMHSRVDAQNIRTGRLDNSEWAELMESARVIGSSNLIIDDTPGISVAEFRSKCRKMKLENNLKCVIVDYLQLMTSGRKSESKQQEVSEISRSLKSIAREINCPVIALSQLSRAVESRDDKRPMLSDLRESGAIEQDADVVMFIYRDEYYHKDTAHPGEAEIIIGKQRNGPTGTVYLKWLPEFTKFANLQKKVQTGKD